MKSKNYKNIEIKIRLITIFFCWGMTALGIGLCIYALLIKECIWAIFAISILVIGIIPLFTIYPILTRSYYKNIIDSHK